MFPTQDSASVSPLQKNLKYHFFVLSRVVLSLKTLEQTVLASVSVSVSSPCHRCYCHLLSTAVVGVQAC